MRYESDENRLFEELSSSFLELQAMLAETATIRGFLNELVALSTRSFSDKVAASVTLIREGRPETVASSDELAALADQGQYGEDDGPCLTAYQTGSETIVSDVNNESRFGDYPKQAASLGLRSIVALPLRSAGDPIGAFNIYSETPDLFNDGSLVRARILSAAAAGALEVAERLAAQSQLNKDLQAAMASRRIIDQALGITMAKQRCDADAAFALLRRRSQTEHRKLRDIAAEVVTETGGMPPADPPEFVPGPTL